MTESYRPQPVPDSNAVAPGPQYGQVSPDGYAAPPAPEYGTPDSGYGQGYAHQNPGQYQGGYPQAPYSAPNPAGSARKARGEEHLKKAQLWVILGLLVSPLIFGILGLLASKKAIECGVDANTWKILSIVELVLAGIGLVFVVIYFFFIFAMIGSGAMTSA